MTLENLWTELANEQIEENMLMLGCEKKYFNGTASHFEAFREWFSALPLLEGNITAKVFLSELEKSLERKVILSEKPTDIWREYNQKKYGYSSSVICDEKLNYIFSGYEKILCDKKQHNYANIFEIKSVLNYNFNSFSEVLNIVEKSRIYQAYAFLYSSEFVRPNRFEAECILKKYNNGENLNDFEYNIFLSQMICEILYKKSNKKIQLFLKTENDLNYLSELLKYLSGRELSSRIYIYINEKYSPEQIKKVCLSAFGECFATPIIEKGEALSEFFLSELAKIYPIGLVK